MKKIIAAVLLALSLQIAGAQSLQSPSNVRIKTTDLSKINNLFLPGGLTLNFYKGPDYPVLRSDNDAPEKQNQTQGHEAYMPYDCHPTTLNYNNDDRFLLIASPYMFYLYYTDVTNPITQGPAQYPDYSNCCIAGK